MRSIPSDLQMKVAALVDNQTCGQLYGRLASGRNCRSLCGGSAQTRLLPMQTWCTEASLRRTCVLCVMGVSRGNICSFTVIGFGRYGLRCLVGMFQVSQRHWIVGSRILQQVTTRGQLAVRQVALAGITPGSRLCCCAGLLGKHIVVLSSNESI